MSSKYFTTRDCYILFYDTTDVLREKYALDKHLEEFDVVWSWTGFSLSALITILTLIVMVKRNAFKNYKYELYMFMV